MQRIPVDDAARQSSVDIGRVRFGTRSALRAATGPESNGRGGQIRTDDLYVPNVALYQAKLHPDYQLSSGYQRIPLFPPRLHRQKPSAQVTGPQVQAQA